MAIVIASDEKKYAKDTIGKLKNSSTGKLYVGDFISGFTVIERKHINDLYNSLFSEKARLFYQLDKLTQLKKEYPEVNIVILIESGGVSKKTRSRIKTKRQII